MSDEPFYKPGLLVPPHTPTPGLHQWTLWKDGARTDCEFRLHGQWGVEVQLLKNGELQVGMMTATMTAAEQLADHEWQRLERAGWRRLTVRGSGGKHDD